MWVVGCRLAGSRPALCRAAHEEWMKSGAGVRRRPGGPGRALARRGASAGAEDVRYSKDSGTNGRSSMSFRRCQNDESGSSVNTMAWSSS